MLDKTSNSQSLLTDLGFELLKLIRNWFLSVLILYCLLKCLLDRGMLLLMGTSVFLELIMNCVQELVHFKKLRLENSFHRVDSVRH